jgi:hypothetical protein
MMHIKAKIFFFSGPILLTLILATVTVNLAIGQSSLTYSKPIFSESDIQAPEVNLDLDMNSSWNLNPITNTFNYTSLYGAYFRDNNSGNGSRVSFGLGIYWYYNITRAQQAFDKFVSMYNHNLDYLRNQSGTIFVETTLNSEQCYLVSGTPPYEYHPYTTYWGEREILAADPFNNGEKRFIIVIQGNGQQFASEYDILNLFDQLEQHAMNLIENLPRITPTVSPTPSPTGTPTPTPTQPDQQKPQPGLEQFEIEYVTGNVLVYQASTGSWTPAKVGMTLKPGDTIQTSGDPQQNIASLRHIGDGISSSNKQIIVRGDAKMLLQTYSSTNPKTTLAQALVQVGLYLGHESGVADVLFKSTVRTAAESAVENPIGAIETAGAWIVDHLTEFEVIVNSTGTTVNTIDGTVEVSDINGTNTVYVNAYQTSYVPNGGTPTAAKNIDVSNMDQWWNLVPVTDRSDSTAPIYNLLPYIVTVVVIVVAAVVAGVVWDRRRKTRTQISCPPPPPPPNRQNRERRNWVF